jgi:hypothetical protein
MRAECASVTQAFDTDGLLRGWFDILMPVASCSGTYVDPVPIGNLRAARRLREWIERDRLGDADEQRRQWEGIKRELDEDRPSDRRLFG